MLKRLSAALAALALAGCGGGGGSSATIPSTSQSQTQGVLAGGTLPATTGTIATGYIECDDAADIAAGNDCNDEANFTPTPGGGYYTFTAIAANASGAPIAQQLSGGGAMSFANGAYQVIESPNDRPAMVSISGGPWSTPGSVLNGAGGAYGNAFTVTCTQVGTATLQLQLVTHSGTTALPLASSAYPASDVSVNCSAAGSIVLK